MFIRDVALIIALSFLFTACGSSGGGSNGDINPTSVSSESPHNRSITYGGIIHDGRPLTEDTATDAQVTADGGYMITGSIDVAVLVLNFNSEGDLSWEKIYGTKDDTYATSLYQTHDEGYVVCGNRYYEAAADDLGVFILKITSMGDVEWYRFFGGPDDLTMSYHNLKRCRSILQVTDGGYVMAGGTGYGDLGWITKLDGDGNVEWERTYGAEEESDRHFSISTLVQTADGGYMLAGRSGFHQSSSSFYPDILWDAHIVKLDSDGMVLWSKNYGEDEYDSISSIRQTEDGKYIAAGTTASYGAGKSDIWVLRIDEEGMIEWQKTFGSKYWEGGRDIRETEDGGYMLGGGIHMSFSSAIVIKLDAEGNVLWDKTYGKRRYYADMSLEKTDGNYAIIGHTYTDGYEDIWILHVDAEGDGDSGCYTSRSDLIQTEDTSVKGTDAELRSTSVSPEERDLHFKAYAVDSITLTECAE